MIRKFRGVKFKIVEQNLHGLCEYHSRTITIDARERRKDYLNTLIHECLHASNPKLSEAVVTRMADELAEVLWSKGFRKREKRPKHRSSI